MIFAILIFSTIFQCRAVFVKVFEDNFNDLKKWSFKTSTYADNKTPRVSYATIRNDPTSQFAASPNKAVAFSDTY